MRENRRKKKMPKIGEILKEKRIEAKMTKKGLGVLTGISVVTLAKYEKGEILPSFERLNKLACALLIDYDWLCDVMSEEKKGRKKH